MHFDRLRWKSWWSGTERRQVNLAWFLFIDVLIECLLSMMHRSKHLNVSVPPLILTTALGEACRYYLCFMNEEAEAKRIWTQLVNHGARMQTQVGLPQSRFFGLWDAACTKRQLGGLLIQLFFLTPLQQSSWTVTFYFREWTTWKAQGSHMAQALPPSWLLLSDFAIWQNKRELGEFYRSSSYIKRGSLQSPPICPGLFLVSQSFVIVQGPATPRCLWTAAFTNSLMWLQLLRVTVTVQVGPISLETVGQLLPLSTCPSGGIVWFEGDSPGSCVGTCGPSWWLCFGRL